MINFGSFYSYLASDLRLQPWLEVLPQQLSLWANQPHGDLDAWCRVLKKLPIGSADKVDLTDSVSLASTHPLTRGEFKKLENLLQSFHPWRKGPYFVHGIHIDTEWRSDWKWDRVLPHLSSLENKTILDVGCGNGYHMWRMLGQKAKLCVGIDPSELFLIQFEAIKRMIDQELPIHLLPIGIEQLPKLEAFDTVFSMGVLYHRKSPLEHLSQLKDQLISGGELVLETLVIEGDEQSVLVPTNRYAQMRNVYFFPSSAALKVWLEQVGFCQVKIVDEAYTSTDEQRTTAWMRHHSLTDYLNPNDQSKTIEDYPAPRRAILIAKKP